jgi:UDP-2,3-diacylglucosamine hydrolase
VSQPTLFIADLHLDPEARPETVELFLAILRGPARDAAHLYILGDLFEVWVGDDDDSPGWESIFAGLRELVAAGVPTSFISGNRDFLAGSGFTERSGCALLPDPTPIDLYGVRTLLTHGDRLCIDDVEHLRFRAHAAQPEVRAAFLARPLAERQAEAQAMRQRSIANKQNKPEAIMDVNPGAVQAALADHEARLVIHGHTHRPALHGDPLERAVLGDWGACASLLRCAADGTLDLVRVHPDLREEVVASAPLPGRGNR